MRNSGFWTVLWVLILIAVSRLATSPIENPADNADIAPTFSLVLPVAWSPNDQSRLVLRNLKIIETDSLKFDSNGVVDADGNEYPWDQILSAELNDGRQEEFDRLLRRVGVPLFRIHHRLANGDWRSLSEVVEPLYENARNEFPTDAGQRNRYLVSLAAFRSRLADGFPARAVIPFVEACEIRRRQPANMRIDIPEIGNADLSDDEIRSEFTLQLPPIWFDEQAAKRSCQELNDMVAKDFKQTTDGSLIYLASLSLAAGKTQGSSDILDELSSRSSQLVASWLPILLVEAEIEAKIIGPATAKLQKNYRKLDGPERALANFLLAIQAGDNPDDLDAAVLDLLYIAANYGSTLQSLSAAALHQASVIALKSGKPDEAAIFQSELSKIHQNTYHGRLQIAK